MFFFPFKWEKEHDEAYDKLVQLCSKGITLFALQAELPIDLYVDASQVAVGAVLSQNKKPIEFYSRRFSATEQRYSTHEREALALVSSCLHFRTILIGRKFTVHTDHKPLCEWLHKKPANERHTRWLVKLQDMQFDIKYICLPYTSPSPRDRQKSRMPSSA